MAAPDIAQMPFARRIASRSAALALLLSSHVGAYAFSNDDTGVKSNPVSDNIAPDYAFNSITVDDDNLDGKTRIFGVSALSIIHKFGAGAGARNTFLVQGSLDKPMLAGSDNQFFVAAYLRELALAGDGGRPGAERGGIFALNPVAEAHAGARDLLEVAGAEVDVSLDRRSSSTRRTGVRVASGGDVHAEYLDSGLDLTGGNVGWGFGILFQADLGRNPVDGTLIGAHADKTPLIAASGIDLGAYRFTSGVSLNLPGGFMVREGRVAAPEVRAARIVANNPASPTPGNQAVLAAPVSAFANLGAGRIGYLKICADCRKPSETQGHGSGMLVFFDGRAWISSANGLPASR